jgi:hypothetical protein
MILMLTIVITLNTDGGTLWQAENPPSILRRPLPTPSKDPIAAEHIEPQDGACEEKGEEAIPLRSQGEGGCTLAVAVGEIVGRR